MLVNAIAAKGSICVVEFVRRGPVRCFAGLVPLRGNREQQTCRFGWPWRNWRPAQQVAQCLVVVQCTFRKRLRPPKCIT
jgi:hypothetical protein